MIKDTLYVKRKRPTDMLLLAAIYQQADATYQKKKATKPAPAASSNRFTQFAQNSYDFAALEKEILSN